MAFVHYPEIAFLIDKISERKISEFARRNAITASELCQIRNEAALSGTFRVLKGCLDRANCIGNVCGYQFEAGRTAFVIKMLLVAANLGMSGRFVMLACKKLYGIPKLSCEAGT